MKTALILALLAVATLPALAQDNKTPELKNNGKAVFVKPTFDRPYRVLFSPPCLEYKRHGVVIMECPGILLAPETGDYDKSLYTGYGTAEVGSPTTYNTAKENEDRNSLSKK